MFEGLCTWNTLVILNTWSTCRKNSLVLQILFPKIILLNDTSILSAVLSCRIWNIYHNFEKCSSIATKHFSERLFRTMADLVVSEGYASVGYEYINVDDCWLEKERSIHGQLVPDRARFPSGMKALADYVSTQSSVSILLGASRTFSRS